MAGIAGIAYVKVSGRQYPLKGNFTVGTTMIERTGIAGQDGFHGFSEMPRVPYIQGDISLAPDVSVEVLAAMTNETVTAELRNGKTYVLREAFTAGTRELNTSEGQVQVRWEGASIDEF
ncbi:phage tail tube protein [Chelatococcus reniformis]|uniref:Phage tail protein n=1 Tax=Chelatococcus reniformis TaxID=1494448 RepID=A0A916UVE4_9HYPH|nr:phage tail tube protein [Chelatococcus reniformis]GGC90361.1 phage tail protein [Chelatococcus reniformis]